MDLALCAGIGGLELALEIAFPEYRCIAAVENNPEAARRFRRRFPQAKIFRNVVGFDGRPFRYRVDCISAGFPCQPHSVAGKRKGTGDERWIWPDIARIIGEAEPGIAALENVAGLLRDAGGNPPRDLEESADDAFGGMGEVLRDLAAMGFVPLWGSVRAAQVGASHGRPRVFILAYHPSRGFRIDRSASRRGGYLNERNGIVEHAKPARAETKAGIHVDGWPPWATRPHDGSGTVENPGCTESGGNSNTQAASAIGMRSGKLADTGNGLLSQPQREAQGRDGFGSTGEILGISTSERLPQRRDDPGLREHAATEQTGNGVVDPARLEPATGRSGRRRRIRGTGDHLGTFAPGPSDTAWFDILAASPHLAPALSPVTAVLALALQQGEIDLQTEIESRFCGLADGVARWLVERRPRLQCGGNGVVPLQAAAVFTVLAKRIGLV